MAGKTVFSAKKVLVDALTESGELVGDVKTINHPVKFFEKGDKPLEIVSTRQWYIVNGARDEQLKETLRKRGEEIAFHPDFMRVRYDNWVGGLSGDWLISRQRFFGVPIPSGTRSTPTATRSSTSRSSRPRHSCPSTRRPSRPPGTPRTSAASPAASRANST